MEFRGKHWFLLSKQRETPQQPSSKHVQPEMGMIFFPPTLHLLMFVFSSSSRLLTSTLKASLTHTMGAHNVPLLILNVPCFGIRGAGGFAVWTCLGLSTWDSWRLLFGGEGFLSFSFNSGELPSSVMVISGVLHSGSTFPYIIRCLLWQVHSLRAIFDLEIWGMRLEVFVGGGVRGFLQELTSSASVLISPPLIRI